MSSTETPEGSAGPKPSAVRLRWSGRGHRFEGSAPGGPRVVVDGDGQEGASPMQLLLLSLAGCMGVDLLMILEKSRVPVEDLEVDVTGDRATSPPRKYERLRLVYRVVGPAEGDTAKLERAVQLSRDTYCSVLHSLRPDLELDVRIERG